ncbi:MAG: hypothetical protein A2W22_03025 [Candidatus Levybacteria bacterium RBG_16_35_11]|nr:MAG: hypothetical protein A2W22_03025 [Candidatus Levybacteria bacterium RBG_16_35_11]
MCNPETILSRENKDGTVTKYEIGHPTEVSQYLWELYSQHVQTVMQIAGGDDLIVFHLGDLTQGNRFGNELISNAIADQFIIAEYNLIPWFLYKNLIAMEIFKGTIAHNFGMGTSDTVTEGYLSRRFPHHKIEALWHGLFNHRGLTMDVAHHGPPIGKRNWLIGNEARYYLKSLIKDEIDHGGVPPRLILRGHRHTLAKETISMFVKDKEIEVTLISLPSYCGFGEYTQQITLHFPFVTNGMVVFEVLDGQIHKTHFLIQTLDIRTRKEI